jgi:hypothetical protein
MSLPNSNGPWYTRFIAQVGIPSAIALYLVYFLTSQLLGAVETHAQESRTSIAQHSASSDELLRQILSVSRQICLNTAETDSARSGCLRLR